MLKFFNTLFLSPHQFTYYLNEAILSAAGRPAEGWDPGGTTTEPIPAFAGMTLQIKALLLFLIRQKPNIDRF
jgi:hypothetical protein